MRYSKIFRNLEFGSSVGCIVGLAVGSLGGAFSAVSENLNDKKSPIGLIVTVPFYGACGGIFGCCIGTVIGVSYPISLPLIGVGMVASCCRY